MILYKIYMSSEMGDRVSCGVEGHPEVVVKKAAL